jgi:ribosomal protein L35
MSIVTSTKKSVASRIRVTKNGKLMRRSMGQGHFKAKKTGKQTRQKRLTTRIAGVDVRTFKRYL